MNDHNDNRINNNNNINSTDDDEVGDDINDENDIIYI